MPLGAQWVAGQALTHCSEEEGVRGDSWEVPGPTEAGVGGGERGLWAWLWAREAG